MELLNDSGILDPHPLTMYQEKKMNNPVFSTFHLVSRNFKKPSDGSVALALGYLFHFLNLEGGLLVNLIDCMRFLLPFLDITRMSTVFPEAA